MKQKDDMESDSIANIDIQSGIARSGGSIKIYREILEAFIQDSFERINEIEKCLDISEPMKNVGILIQNSS